MEKTYRPFLFTLVLYLVACSGRETRPPEPVIKDLIKNAFSQRDFAINFQLDRRPYREFTILYKESIKDSLLINQNLFRINPEKALVDPRNIIAVTLDSVNNKTRTLKFEHIYYPALTTRLDGKYTFVYQANNWILIEDGISISDGNYKLPKY